MTRLSLSAPLAGWALPLAQVCDEVFAQGMAGEGLAIDPTGDTLHAPCDGEIVLMGQARHALTLRAAGGVDLLMHVGIDTVNLHGEGFELLVRAGQRVKRGEALLRFDLDKIARRPRSAVTPVLVVAGGRVITRQLDRVVAVGDALMEIECDVVAASTVQAATQLAEARAHYRVIFDHGLHARPAAQVVAALKPYVAEVSIHARGRSGNARSAVALMALGVQSGDEIEVVARGNDAGAVLEALGVLLLPIARAQARAVATPSPALPGEAPQQAQGVIAVRGLALGEAVLLTEPEREVAEFGDDTLAEAAALDGAITRTVAQLQARIGTAQGAQRELLQAHAELIADPELAAQAHAHVARGKSAAYAWRQAIRASIGALESLGNAHMSERAADLRDLENQVLRVLAGEAPSEARALPEHAVLIADELLPSQLAVLDATRISGICMARGGPTSHVALLAAARGIPTLVAAGEGVLAISPGTALLLDADRGVLKVDPPRADQQALRETLKQRAAQEAADLAAAAQAAITRDGLALTVCANLGASVEAAPAVARGAEGCGLLRTEFLFLDRRLPPSEDEQQAEYASIAQALSPRPLTIRTLDVGGDKPLAYLQQPREENPVLGVRGLRLCLLQPEILRTQLRAILRAGEASRLKIMLPMVSDIADLRAAREVLDLCAAELGLKQTPALGVMIETPSSALIADQLAREADFLSIGTNDLSQYVLAMDRGHASLAARLDALHPAVLRLIGTVARAGAAAGKLVSVCGGLGSDSAAIPLLIGLGVREVSAVPQVIARIKRRVRELDARECESLAREAQELYSAQAVRALVAARIDSTQPRPAAGGGA